MFISQFIKPAKYLHECNFQTELAMMLKMRETEIQDNWKVQVWKCQHDNHWNPITPHFSDRNLKYYTTLFTH